MSGTGHLDINPADRARLLASATAYAAGRRTYVVGAVSDVVAANAGRLDAAVRETLADAIRPAADACECPCCSTVFRVRTLMTDGAGRLMRDEYETIPMFCPMCGGRLEQSERKE